MLQSAWFRNVVGRLGTVHFRSVRRHPTLFSSVSGLEHLEDRTLLTAYVVDTILDDPAGGVDATDGRLSLREAINAANSNAAFGDAAAGSGTEIDTITFQAIDPAGQPLATDQRGAGFPRAIGQVDIGAVEATPTTVVVDLLTDEKDGDYSAGDLSLREAIEIVAVGGTITFAASLAGGTITLGGTRIDLTKDVTITGLGADQLTISGNDISQIFYVGAGATAEISGLTLKRGKATGTTSDTGAGGAIYNNGRLTIINSVLSGHTADVQGGAILNNGTLTISGSTLTENLAHYSGGAIFNINDVNSDGRLTITDSVLSRNSIITGGGGAISNWGGSVAITNGTFSENHAENDGGAITNAFGGSVTITHSSLLGNSVRLVGGAIYTTSGTFAIANSTISGNSALNDGGGGIRTDGGLLTLTNVTLFGNRADADGDGRGPGGGLFAAGTGTVLLNNTLIAGNIRGAEGGAETSSDVAGVVDVSSRNNLIGDAATAGGLADAVNGNIVGVDWTTVIDSNLADNGGTTLTHALLDGSVAIDAGDDAAVVDSAGNPLTTDQRGNGFDRISGDGVDIGAFELQTVTVDTLVDEDDGDYSAGDLSLREAIGLVATSGTINFDESLAGGTIVLGGTRLDLVRDVTITGLGAESLTVSGNNASQIFYVAARVTAEITGLTLTSGRADGGSATLDAYNGGAIFNGGTLTVADSVLIDNFAEIDGGGIFHHFSAGSLSITNSVLSGNSADNGGAIYSRSRVLTVVDSVFSGNSAGFHGGAIYDFVGTLTVVNSTFDRNITRFSGGAVGTNGGKLSFTDTTFTGNSAGSSGGAIANSAGTLTVTFSTLSGNRSIFGGAIDNDDDGVATVINSTLSGNAADSTGGGVFNGATLTLTNSTLFGNRAEADGGESSDVGGGLFVRDSADSTLLNNTLIAGNVYGAVGGAEMPGDIAGVVDTLSRNNLIGDAATAGGLVDGTNGNIVGVDWTTVIDPNLADNGGPTLTHALLDGSVAIDAAAVDSAGNPLTTDQRGDGFDRMIGYGVDIGAFEVQTVAIYHWEAESPEMGHRIGRADGDGWSAGIKYDRPGYLLLGPAATAIPAGVQFATFRLLVRNTTADRAKIVRLEVFDASTRSLLAQRVLTRDEFTAPFTYQDFDLAFLNTVGSRLKFRLWWYDTAYVRADSVRVTTLPPPPLVREAERHFGHRVGQASAEGWTAKPSLDRAGFLAFGGYTTTVPAGPQAATFRLRVNNNTANNARIVTLDVRDTVTGQILAQRVVRRTDFVAANVFQEFVLNFDNLAGSRLSFRVYWHDTAVVKLDRVIVTQTPTSSTLEARAFAVLDAPAPQSLVETTGLSVENPTERMTAHVWSADVSQGNPGGLAIGPDDPNVLPAGRSMAAIQGAKPPFTSAPEARFEYRPWSRDHAFDEQDVASIPPSLGTAEELELVFDEIGDQLLSV